MRIVFNVILMLAAAAGPALASAPALVGIYDGSQMEMAVGLELLEDGRFRYALAYGAMDEQAEGTWTVEDGKLLLTSDPVTPPRFLFVGQAPAPAGQILLSLETTQGVTPQLFNAAVDFADGRREILQLDERPEPIALDPKNPPVRATLFLRMFDLQSDAMTIDSAKGYRLEFRFEPNDIGKADFQREALEIDHGELQFRRFDRLIRFRRSAP